MFDVVDTDIFVVADDVGRQKIGKFVKWGMDNASKIAVQCEKHGNRCKRSASLALSSPITLQSPHLQKVGNELDDIVEVCRFNQMLIVLL